ncbi:hypothetical protein KSP40_PGU001485 [Platanthera guangdongensis]|uniref:Fungal lipase-type domain-containing protein n=1 Tax=Platanthera guangdongensis TaxID=2320717 RepID=A0ABR2LMM5_9ASPA
MNPCSSSLLKSCLSTRQSFFPTPRHNSCISCRRTKSAIPVAVHRSAAAWLGKRWAEYQGASNWDGLLEPLNPTLCSEILRYGDFVQAAYCCRDLDPCFPSRLHLSGLPCSGYRITRSLQATSGTRLPCWAAAAVPSSLSRQSSWIGFVAVCEDSEIARLGRRDVVISLRGTVTFLEWLDNLRATLTSAQAAPFRPTPVHRSKPMVECGFWSLFTSPAPAVSLPSLRDQIRDEVRRLVHHYAGNRGPDISITITGHSLGAALAVLAADDITAILGCGAVRVTVVSFGGPRVGNAGFRRRIEEQGIKVLRIVNTSDIITKVPGFVIGDQEEDGLCPNWLLSKTGWVYADIGHELRVRSRRTANVAACHDLRHYLQLVNQLGDESSPESDEEQGPVSGWRWQAVMAGATFVYNVSNSFPQYD